MNEGREILSRVFYLQSSFGGTLRWVRAGYRKIILPKEFLF